MATSIDSFDMAQNNQRANSGSMMRKKHQSKTNSSLRGILATSKTETAQQLGQPGQKAEQREETISAETALLCQQTATSEASLAYDRQRLEENIVRLGFQLFQEQTRVQELTDQVERLQSIEPELVDLRKSVSSLAAEKQQLSDEISRAQLDKELQIGQLQASHQVDIDNLRQEHAEALEEHSQGTQDLELNVAAHVEALSKVRLQLEDSKSREADNDARIAKLEKATTTASSEMTDLRRALSEKDAYQRDQEAQIQKLENTISLQLTEHQQTLSNVWTEMESKAASHAKITNNYEKDLKTKTEELIQLRQCAADLAVKHAQELLDVRQKSDADRERFLDQIDKSEALRDKMEQQANVHKDAIRIKSDHIATLSQEVSNATSQARRCLLSQQDNDRKSVDLIFNLQEQLRQSKKQLEEVSRESQADSGKQAEINCQVNVLSDRIDTWAADTPDLQTKITVMQSSINSLQTMINDLQSKLPAKRLTNNAIQSTLNTVQIKLNTLQIRLNEKPRTLSTATPLADLKASAPDIPYLGAESLEALRIEARQVFGDHAVFAANQDATIADMLIYLETLVALERSRSKGNLHSFGKKMNIDETFQNINSLLADVCRAHGIRPKKVTSELADLVIIFRKLAALEKQSDMGGLMGSFSKRRTELHLDSKIPHSRTSLKNSTRKSYIPEYVIICIDGSGSMSQWWPMVKQAYWYLVTKMPKHHDTKIAVIFHSDSKVKQLQDLSPITSTTISLLDDSVRPGGSEGYGEAMRWIVQKLRSVYLSPTLRHDQQSLRVIAIGDGGVESSVGTTAGEGVSSLKAMGVKFHAILFSNTYGYSAPDTWLTNTVSELQSETFHIRCDYYAHPSDVSDELNSRELLGPNDLNLQSTPSVLDQNSVSRSSTTRRKGLLATRMTPVA